MLLVYSQLVPLEILVQFGIDRTLTDSEGRPLYECRLGHSSVELSLRHIWDAEDPILYLQLADTPNNQIEVVLFVVNDPYSERFNRVDSQLSVFAVSSPWFAQIWTGFGN